MAEFENKFLENFFFQEKLFLAVKKNALGGNF